MITTVLKRGLSPAHYTFCASAWIIWVQSTHMPWWPLKMRQAHFSGYFAWPKMWKRGYILSSTHKTFTMWQSSIFYFGHIHSEVQNEKWPLGSHLRLGYGWILWCSVLLQKNLKKTKICQEMGSYRYVFE